jgi:DnaJ like chaperone protein
LALLANPQAAGRIIADVIFTGPRLIHFAVASFQQVFRLARADRTDATAMLAFLTSRLHRTALVELAQLLPGRDPMIALVLLQELDLVLFLGQDPVGVILRLDARAELDELPGTIRGFDSVPPEEPQIDDPAEDDEDLKYYVLLGIHSPASPSDIKAAYRARIKQCHPDKFAGRGPEFRRMAEERTKELNEAYEVLMAKYNPAHERSS